MSDNSGCGCLSLIIILIFLALAFWYGLLVPEGALHLDMFPPAVRLEK